MSKEAAQAIVDYLKATKTTILDIVSEENYEKWAWLGMPIEGRDIAALLRDNPKSSSPLFGGRVYMLVGILSLSAIAEAENGSTDRGLRRFEEANTIMEIVNKHNSWEPGSERVRRFVAALRG